MNYRKKPNIGQIPQFDLGRINNVNLSSPANGEILQFNGTNWVNANPLADYVTLDTAQTITGAKTFSGDTVFERYLDFTINVPAFRFKNSIKFEEVAGENFTGLTIATAPSGGNIPLFISKNGISLFRISDTDNQNAPFLSMKQRSGAAPAIVNPPNEGVIYIEDGALMYKGVAGTITTVASS